MDTNKTVLLFSPHLLKKNGNIFELLHINKQKKSTTYKKEPLNILAAKKYFNQAPESFFQQLNKFTEKNLEVINQELSNMVIKTGSKNDEYVHEKKLYEYIIALKPYMNLVKFYHQFAIAENSKRFKTTPCSFSNNIPALSFTVNKAPEGFYFLDTNIELNKSLHPLNNFTQTSFMLSHKNEYFILRFADYNMLKWLQTINWRLEGANEDLFAANILSRVEKEYSVNRKNFVNAVDVEVLPVMEVVLSELNNQFLMLTPQFNYDGFITEGNFLEKTTIINAGKEFIIKRDRKAETLLLQELLTLHPNFENQLNGYYYLSFEEAQKKNWFLKAFKKLLDLNVKVLGMDMLKHFRYRTDKPVSIVTLLKAEDEKVYINFTTHFGDEEIAFADLQKIIRNGLQAIVFKDGSIGLLDEEWIDLYGTIAKHAVIEKNNIILPKWIAIALEQNEKEKKLLPPLLKYEWWKKWLLWQQTNTLIYEIPDAISASLRTYQQKGYEWMRLLDEIGAGIFLADDMGLGKTLQTICYAAYVITKHLQKKLLIVCPASLIYNWQNELAKFAPSLKAYVYHGAIRDKKIFVEDTVQIIITSYGTLRVDEPIFLSHSFAAVILDESHTIKNPASQIARLTQQLSTTRRVVLSGTPVMNNTFDLYSQLHFTLPGMFGSRDFFKREYADPIDKEKNKQRANELRKLVAPFILRRTKEQVAKDLPLKTETILWCQMDAAQLKIYNEIKGRIWGQLQTAIKENGLQKTKLQVLQGILKLRQVCNSPLLLKEEDYNCNESIKTTQLLEEIENNLSNHKALVFSQFTSMIKILSDELTLRKIPHLVLTGSTNIKQRNELVHEFNNNESHHKVFLLSLKAGNAGLNLTAADYVFLFDPWWNNAVEQQAIDRTHRIGQTKNIFAYRLICKSSIEEKILQLQQTKKQLSEELITAEDGFVKALSEEDVAFLFT
jgi:SNF2 family DNA or RNA helicase